MLRNEAETEREMREYPDAESDESIRSSDTTFDWTSHEIGRGRSEWHAIANIGIQVASALDHAHAQGVLHRDIKPSNLLLDAQGTVWVTDFGLATIMEAEKREQPGEVAGTLRFMAPEHIGGKQDSRSDVYSLGLTLYELLTKRPRVRGCQPNIAYRENYFRTNGTPADFASRHSRRLAGDRNESRGQGSWESV